MKKYLVLSADNIGNDIKVRVFDDRVSAKKFMTELYKEILKDIDDNVESKTISKANFNVMDYDGNYYYGQIKEIEV